MLHDLDDHLANSARALVNWSNGWVDLARLGIAGLTLDHYHEDFPTLWGVSSEEANKRWAEYCSKELGKVEPVADMQRAFQGFPETIISEILTSRGQHTAGVTAEWVARHYPRIQRVHHTTADWQSDPLAHTRTKDESIKHYLKSGILPRLPDLIADDNPNHMRACRDLRAQGARIGHIVLSGDYPWNKAAQRDEGLVWLPTPDLFAEYVLEAADKKLHGSS